MMYFLQRVTQAYSEKENPTFPTGVEVMTSRFTGSDALPLSYRRLVGAKAIKLGSCEKYPAYS